MGFGEIVSWALLTYVSLDEDVAHKLVVFAKDRVWTSYRIVVYVYSMKRPVTLASIRGKGPDRCASNALGQPVSLDHDRLVSVGVMAIIAGC